MFLRHQFSQISKPPILFNFLPSKCFRICYSLNDDRSLGGRWKEAHGPTCLNREHGRIKIAALWIGFLLSRLSKLCCENMELVPEIITIIWNFHRNQAHPGVGWGILKFGEVVPCLLYFSMDFIHIGNATDKHVSPPPKNVERVIYEYVDHKKRYFIYY